MPLLRLWRLLLCNSSANKGEPVLLVRHLQLNLLFILLYLFDCWHIFIILNYIFNYIYFLFKKIKFILILFSLKSNMSRRLYALESSVMNLCRIVGIGMSEFIMSTSSDSWDDTHSNSQKQSNHQPFLYLKQNLTFSSILKSKDSEVFLLELMSS